MHNTLGRMLLELTYIIFFYVHDVSLAALILYYTPILVTAFVISLKQDSASQPSNAFQC